MSKLDLLKQKFSVEQMDVLTGTAPLAIKGGFKPTCIETPKKSKKKSKKSKKSVKSNPSCGCVCPPPPCSWK